MVAASTIVLSETTVPHFVYNLPRPAPIPKQRIFVIGTRGGQEGHPASTRLRNLLPSRPLEGMVDVNRAGEGLDVEEAQVAEAQRDPRRFAALYEANFDKVYAFVARRVRNRSEAEDITANVFHKALANLHRFEWRGVPFAAWLMRIAVNEISDRKRDRSTPVSDLVVEAVTDLPDVERRAALFGSVRALP